MSDITRGCDCPLCQGAGGTVYAAGNGTPARDDKKLAEQEWVRQRAQAWAACAPNRSPTDIETALYEAIAWSGSQR